jgi:hypothetical protein
MRTVVKAAAVKSVFKAVIIVAILAAPVIGIKITQVQLFN